MIRRLTFLGALLCPSITAMAAGLPGQQTRLDLGVDVRGVTYFQRDTTSDMEWDFAIATADGVKVAQSSTTAPGGYVVSTLSDSGTGESTAGQDVVAIANPDTSNDGTLDLAWVVRTGTGLKLWCAQIEGAFVQFRCSSHQDIGGGGATRVIVGPANLDGDPWQDIVIAAGDQLSTVLSDGTGYLTPTITTLPGSTAGLAVGEFSGDGLDDVAVTIGTDIVTYESVGGGSVQQLQVLAAGATLGSIATGDADSNGIADLAVVDLSTKQIRIVDGAPSTPPHSLGQLFAPPAGLGITQLFEVTFDDRDADGDDDLVIAGDDWIVLERNDVGSYGYERAIPGLGQTSQLVATNTHSEIGQGGGQTVLIYRKGSGGSYLEGDSLLVGRGALASQTPEARVFSASGAPLGPAVTPFGSTSWGTGVGAGNIAAQADPVLGVDVDEAIFGPGPGQQYGPQVRAFRPASASWIAKVNFYAYGSLRYGVNAGAGDIDGVGAEEIVTGAGAGAVFGPHVRAFRFDGNSLQAAPKVSFFAYSTLKYGVNPASGSIDTDGPAEMVTAPGPGAMFSPQVRGWNYDGAAVASIVKVNFNAFGTPSFGARVATGDFDQDLMAEIVAAPGPGGSEDFSATFRGFNFDGVAVSAMGGFEVTASSLPSRYGAIPAAAELDPSSPLTGDALVGTAGPQPGLGSLVVGWTYEGGALRPVNQLSFAGFTPSEGGASVACGAFF